MAGTKAPAFQFYPGDFLADAKQTAASATAVGCYIRLICHCWLEKSLPDQRKILARLSGYTGSHWGAIWAEIEECFERRDGRLIHPRIELERQKQAEYREKKRLAGVAGGKQKASNRASKPLADPLAKLSSSSSSSVLKADNQLTRKISTAAPPLRAVATNTRRSPDNRLRVMVKIAHACLEGHDPPTDFASLKDAVKTHCAKAHIRYDSDVIGKAVESALAQARR